MTDEELPSAVEEKPATVAVLARKAANRRALRLNLDGYRVLTPSAFDGLAGHEIDLFIVDLSLVRKHYEDLRQWREACSPILVPILLVVPPGDIDQAFRFNGLVEDIVTIPIRKVELVSRVQSLMKLRRMSKRQEAARLETEAALARVSRAFRAFSACNEAVVWAAGEKSLLGRACELTVSEGGYQMAWAGYAEQDSEKSVRIVAGTQEAVQFVRRIKVTWGSDAFGCGTVGPCIRTGEPVAIADVFNDPAFEPWRAQAADYGFASIISLPLRVKKTVIGILTIMSDRKRAFDEGEVELLSRMTNNLAYGIQSLRESEARKAEQTRATYLAYRDSLTGVANRIWLTETLSELSDSDCAAVLFIDLDGFKFINDALGHGLGDQLLCQVAGRLQRVVRGADLVARQGGDEFIVLIRQAARSGEDEPARLGGEALASMARQVADRILASLSQPFQLDSYTHRLSASIGISLFPSDAVTPDALMTAADQAMYNAKRTGGDNVRFFARELSVHHTRQLGLQRRLRDAVEDCAFELHFQPIVDVQTERIVSLEALIRWPQPDGSSVSPGEFIPLAEETGLIRPLGRWIIKEALRLLVLFRKISPELTMAINLSVIQFREADLVTYIAESLVAADLPPEAVSFEVTETEMVGHAETVERPVNELNAAGHDVALDDFGTGFSSLWRLKELPLSTLKIDKYFLAGAPADTEAVTMIDTILNMARNLAMKVVAEGVERPDQWTLLKQMDCHLAQGYLISRPQPFATMEQLLAEGIPPPASSTPQ